MDRETSIFRIAITAMVFGGLGFWLGRRVRNGAVELPADPDYLLDSALSKLLGAASTFAKAKNGKYDTVLRDQALFVEASLKEVYELQRISGGIRDVPKRIRVLKIATQTIRDYPEYFPGLVETDVPRGADKINDERSERLSEALRFVDKLPLDSRLPRSGR